MAPPALIRQWAKLVGLAAALGMVAVLGGISLTGEWPKGSSLERVTGDGIVPVDEVIASVEISQGDKDIIFQHASEGGWMVGDRPSTPAISEHVETAIRFLRVSDPRRVIKAGEYDAAKLAEFGLDPPRMRVTLVTGGGRGHSMVFGEATPAQNSQYVRVLGQPSLYLLSRYVGVEWQIAADMALRTLPAGLAAQDAARQRQGALLLPASMAQIAVVEILENGALTRFERDPAGDWFHHVGQHVHEPGGLVHKADPKLAPLIANELAALEEASVAAVVAKHPADATLAQFGLEHASSIVLLYTRDSSRPVARIEFGMRSDDGFLRYALVRETDSIVAVPRYSTAHVDRLLQLAGASR